MKEDHKVQDKIGNLSRRITRKNFIERTMALTAGFLAFFLVKPTSNMNEAFAHASAPCYPPFGNYCSGCKSNGQCPTGYITCTRSNDKCKRIGYCIYASGWWYTANVGGRHRCYDCQFNNGPIPCNGGKSDQCGCKSTIHY